VCTVPDSLLKGITNEKLVRSLRQVNPTARIIAPAEVLADARQLIDAGASYVCVGRILEGRELLEALKASDEGLIDEKRERLLRSLAERREVLP
jgi:hypothetical protein